MIGVGRIDKEDYFHGEFFEYLHERYFSRDKWEKIKAHSKNVAILGLDLQIYFLNKIPSMRRFIKHLSGFYGKVAGKIPILLTCHYDVDGSIMTFWWDNKIEKDSPHYDLLDIVKSFPSEIIEKTTYDAFYNTDLEDILKRLNIDTLIITGVMTNVCCETTARSAFVRGYKIIFPLDGTVSKNRYFHEATIMNLSYSVAVVPTLKEVVDWLL